MTRRPSRFLTLVVLLLLASVAPAGAAQTRRFVLDTPGALAGASAHGMAVLPDGSLRALPPLETVAAFDEPLGLALAVAGDATAYVGTGHPARVWRIRGRDKEVLGELGADQVTSLLLSPKGDLWAATAVPATLVRFAGARGKPEVVARLAEGNLWDLAWFGDSVVAAAGNPGRVVRLQGTALEPLFTVPDTHARALAVAPGALLVGTSGKGLILRWTGAGPAGVLVDSAFTEIAALAVAPDGSTWAAALTGDPTLGKPPKEESAGSGEATVTVSEGATPPPPSTDRGPATSELLRVHPSGAATTVHRFSRQIASALAWHPNGPVVGTGLEGELWQVIDGNAAQLDDLEAAQVVRVAAGGEWVLTQGPVELRRRQCAPRGTFTSPVLDAGLPASWGQAATRARVEAGSSCSLRFRSGATAEPDETWSEWTAPAACGTFEVDAPPARYVQWQVELSGAESRVEQVQLAYRQVNLAPELRRVDVHEPGEIFLKAPPPSDRVIEVQHPDLSGIFTVVDEADQERQATLGKRYYRVGYQSVSWRAEDPNGDPLQFTLEVQPAGGDRWTTVRERLETTVVGLDTQALPDGVYRFRVTATDAAANPGAPEKAQSLSSYFTIDNTAPAVRITRDGDAWKVSVTDALSPVALVEWNRDADAWHAAAPEDGLLDGTTETFRIPAGKGRLLTVRAVDDHHNRATASAEEGT